MGMAYLVGFSGPRSLPIFVKSKITLKRLMLFFQILLL